MGLKIEQQWASIGLKYTPSKLQIERKPGNFNIEGGTSDLEIKQGSGKLDISNTPFYESIGLYKPTVLWKRQKSEAKDVVDEGIQRYVQEGMLLADVHKNKNMVSKISGSSLWSKEVTVEAKAVQGPSINYKRSEVGIDVQNKPIHVDCIPDTINITIHPTIIEMYLEQKPSIDVEWTGTILNSVK